MMIVARIPTHTLVIKIRHNMMIILKKVTIQSTIESFNDEMFHTSAAVVLMSINFYDNLNHI